MELETLLAGLLGLAVLIPLGSFFVILIGGPNLGKHGVAAGWIATGAILASAIASFAALGFWLANHSPFIDPVSEAHGPEAAPTRPAVGGVQREPSETGQHDVHGEHAEGGAEDHGEHDDHHGPEYALSHVYSGEYWLLGQFNLDPERGTGLRLAIGYYIDTLTIAMFCMVTLIATCIHFYATGYMHDELHDVVDHEVTLDDGHHLHRPGRYHRFFQALSLFCFSMLGLVLAGNALMVFMFWELVGICSYFLIGFYVERKSASNAANKAFIVNRVGDFGMIIGLMALWAALGTFSFGDVKYVDASGQERTERGIFTQLREHGELRVPARVAQAASPDFAWQLLQEELRGGADLEEAKASVAAQFRHMQDRVSERRDQLKETDALRAAPGVSEAELRQAAEPRRQTKEVPFGYWLLFVAGVGIFCGCVGKSAQFPLHVWLPDAMEGPTPVSALVHSATMVAAGVYLVGRFYPAFVPEVLLVIAVIGVITLFLAATIAITATDIKRVLAYSTISQLGYMMMALGVGGWVAGMMHLITHAFFKSLLFLCSGSVIHAVHTNEMPLMGGLRKKMPYTAYTMLVGCLAIAGAGVPFMVGLSGYYSKDAMLEQALSFARFANPSWAAIFFWIAAAGAAVTSFYMFRLWYMTFAGEPRDHHRYDHAHESPKVMYVPLMILSAFAIAVAWRPMDAIFGGVLFGVVMLILIVRAKVTQPANSPAYERIKRASAVVGILLLALGALAYAWQRTVNVSLADLLENARPESARMDMTPAYLATIWPDEHKSHVAAIRVPVTLLAFGVAVGGFLLATLFYGWRTLSADEVRRQFSPIHRLLVNKWYFDEMYHYAFFKPTHVIARSASWLDRRILDGAIDATALGVRWFARQWDYVADRKVVDGLVNGLASLTYSVGLAARRPQRGHLREYVVYIVVGAVALFVVALFFRERLFAG